MGVITMVDTKLLKTLIHCTVAIWFLTILITTMIPTFAASISQGYVTEDVSLKVGMAAAISTTSTSQKQIIEAATRSNADRFVGITTTVDANLVNIKTKDMSVYVTTVGQAAVFATDLNGEIKRGDFLTLSPLKGVIMRADAEETNIIGLALEDFSITGAQSEEVNNSDGTTQTVRVDSISMEISPRDVVGGGGQKKPLLVLFGQSLTGKAVSQWQILSALVIFFILLIVEGSIVYGAVHSTIIALGRNPLARKAVYKQLLQVGGFVLIILVFGSAVIYAVLWA